MEAPTRMSLLKNHLPLLAGVLTTLFITLRIFSAAEYNPVTAYGILQAEGTGTVIIGSLLSIIGTLPVWLTLICVLTYDDLPEKERNSARSLYVGALALLFLIGFFITPALNLLFMALAVSADTFLRADRLRNTRISREARVKLPPELQFEVDKRTRELVQRLGKRRRGLAIAVVIIVIVLWQSTISATPWLPTERVDIKGTTPLVGWVLSSSQPFTSVLLTTGQIKYVATNTIVGREICIEFEQAALNKTIPELTSRPVYPDCSSLGTRR